MKSNKRLGRGLEALIPQISPDEEPARKDALSDIAVSVITSNPWQPRQDFDRNSLEQLKQSILENGVIQPITVRRAGDGYELIAGERRLRAVQELGFERVPAFVMVVQSEDQMLELALVENIQRENLNPIETARAYQQLQTEYGLTQDAIAKKVGKDRATVANFMRLLKLPAEIQKSLQTGEISMGHARALMGLSDEAAQIQMWRKVVKEGWNVRQVEKAVQREESGRSGKDGSPVPPAKASPHLQEIEDKLRTVFGTQVRVIRSSKGGKIEVAFYSDDDLERILELMYQAGE